MGQDGVPQVPAPTGPLRAAALGSATAGPPSGTSTSAPSTSAPSTSAPIGPSIAGANGAGPAAAPASGPAPASAAPPATFPPPVARTIDWLQARYADWYARNPPPMPDRFTRREFGYILWPERPGPPPFVRHRAYEEAGRLHAYLQRAGPHSVYYSTAYYRRPGEMKMADKQWLGAELIFDLDADHLAEAEAAKAQGHEMTVADQLRLVKAQFKRLLDEFLLGDFGLSESDVWITFSGGRGYHAHVVEPRLMQLGSKERREIVDYITGKFPADSDGVPDLGHLFGEDVISADTFKGRTKRLTKFRFPTPDEPGWGGRLSKAVFDDLREHVIAKPEAEAVRWLVAQRLGVGEKTAEGFVRFWSEDKLDRFLHGRLEGGVLRGKGDLAGTGHVGNAVRRFFERAIEGQKVELGEGKAGLRPGKVEVAKGETDEPVTADVKRLIRLPGSLHGKSGLKVVTLRRDELDAFDPLRDAVAFSMDPVAIVPRNDQEMTLGGERVAVRKGEPVPVPEAHAVWWCARQAATVAPRPDTR